MKKLLILIVIITLPLIAFFEYASWKRYNPPSEYGYTIPEDIDVNYYDADMVKEYFENAVEIGRFAREKYRSEKIDVRYPNNENLDEVNASKYYHNLIARNQLIEGKLKQSQKLKGQGLNNQEVQLVVEKGASTRYIRLHANQASYLLLKLGDEGKEVWELQKALLGKNLELPLDGTFGVETEKQLAAFQNQNSIYPSGVLDEETFALLFSD